MDIMEWIRKDIVIIVVCLATILICLTAYMNTTIVLEKCNSNWEQQFKTYCTDYQGEPTIITEEYPVFNLSNWVSE